MPPRTSPASRAWPAACSATPPDALRTVSRTEDSSSSTFSCDQLRGSPWAHSLASSTAGVDLLAEVAELGCDAGADPHQGRQHHRQGAQEDGDGGQRRRPPAPPQPGGQGLEHRGQEQGQHHRHDHHVQLDEDQDGHRRAATTTRMRQLHAAAPSRTRGTFTRRGLLVDVHRAPTLRWTLVPGTDAGYSGTPLPRKLGIKEGFRVALVGAPAGFGPELEPLPAGVHLVRRLARRCPRRPGPAVRHLPPRPGRAVPAAGGPPPARRRPVGGVAQEVVRA